jgi:hypothetical protein
MARARTQFGSTAFADLAKALLETARDGAPDDTGKLRAGMWAVVYVDARRVWSEGPAPTDTVHFGEGIEIVIGNDVPYARYVHDGTVDTEQHPFLANALATITVGSALAVR